MTDVDKLSPLTSVEWGYDQGEETDTETQDDIQY